MLGRMLASSLHARRARLVLALLAVTLGVAVSIALAALALQVGDDLARTLRAAGPHFVVMPAGARWPLDLGGAEIEPPRAGLGLAIDAVARLKSGFWRNNVLDAAPERTAAATLGGAPVTLVGTWFDHSLALADGTWRTGLARLKPRALASGRWPAEDANEVALGSAWGVRHRMTIGSMVNVAIGTRAHAMRVTGLVSADPREADRAWVPLAWLDRVAGGAGRIDRVWLSALVRPPSTKSAPDPKRDPAGYERHMCTAYPDVVANALANDIAHSEVLPMTEMVSGEGAVVGRLNLLMLLLALAAIVASVLGLLSTSTATVIERSVELGLLRALGATSPQIATLLLAETLIVSLAGGILGFGLGVAGAAAIRGDTFGTSAALSPLLLPLAILIAVAVAIVGTLAPLRMALRLDPAQVLRG
jgi:putative ABC transport system permease protein